MTTQNTNPFVLPGFGQGGEMGQNPILTSMEMMRQAWQGLAGSGALSPQSLGLPMDIDELDKRIADMRAVENWLRMSSTMLASTIQGLEVQRATIATLKAFVATSAPEEGGAGNPSPLEVALGIKPSGQAKIKTMHDTDESAAHAKGPLPGMEHGDPAQGWWNMLQNQFNTLAAATMQGAEAVQAAAAPLAEQAAQAVAAAGNAARPAESAVKSPVAKKAVKRAAPASKAAPRKSRTAAKTRSS